MSHRHRVAVIDADLTTLAVDAIANAANSSLLGGGGVDGAIHRAAGPELVHACRLLGGCPTGEARITPGFNLPAKWVCHTVGPVWNGGHQNEDELLASCYRWVLQLALKAGARTVAFPSISTGIYGFPIERAARIAVSQVRTFLINNDHFDRVTHVTFGQSDNQIYNAMVDEIYALA